MKKQDIQQLEERARKNEWILLKDYPQKDKESDTDYWSRIYSLMPQEQKDSIQGSLAQIFSYKLIPNKVIMNENIFHYMNEK